MNVAAGKSVTSLDITKNVTKKNKQSETSEIRSKTNFIVNNIEKVVHDDVPDKNKSKITIFSEVRILPKTDRNKKAQTTKKEEGKAGPSGITIKREL
ncbi:unnamed protein product [Parnassius apollo]|uniref:(apollo) hypothetical protein n=1 Tax=Parnassius apollo TaxID=110799 RepID=A0A8S3WRP9_PARAO|nr:unnamed protein product [Parnassius apollo]